MKPMLRYAAAGCALTGVLVLTGCGLSDADKQICDAAAAKNPANVYRAAPQAKDKDIKAQAEKIYPGSPDASDSQAMTKIVQLCKDKGYRPVGS